jgi:hypothetical protein
MSEVIVYVPCKLIKIGGTCRLVAIREQGLARLDNEYKTVDTINPDLMYNAKQCLPRSLFQSDFITLYDTCMKLGHTDKEARSFFNKFLLYSDFKALPEPPLHLDFDDLHDMVLADEEKMDDEFKSMLENMTRFR